MEKMNNCYLPRGTWWYHLLVIVTAAAAPIQLPGGAIGGSDSLELISQWAVAFQGLYPEAELSLHDVVSPDISQTAVIQGHLYAGDCISRRSGVCEKKGQNDKMETNNGGDKEQDAHSILWGFGDLPLGKTENHSALQQFSSTGSAVVPVISAPPADMTNLTLSLEAIASIFNSSIQYWDDPVISSLNPGNSRIPHEKISVVVREDNCGPSYIFNSALSQNEPNLMNEPTGMGNQSNNTIQVMGDNAVLSRMLRTPWSISYMSWRHYLQFQDLLSKVQVTIGNDTKSAANSMQRTDVISKNDDAPLDYMSFQSQPGRYPMMGYFYWYIPKTNQTVPADTLPDCHSAWLLQRFIEWTYTNKQAASIARDSGWIVHAQNQTLSLIQNELSGKLCIDNDHGSNSSIIPVGSYTPPAYRHKLNLIQPGFLYFGYFCFSALALFCLYCAGWLWWHRTKWIVKASQPILLWGIITGVLIWSTSILLHGVQTEYGLPEEYAEEEDSYLLVNMACRTAPWAYGVGFGLTFSMLLAKILRIKLIFEAAQNKTKQSKRNKKHQKNPTASISETKVVSFRKVSPIVILIFVVELSIIIGWRIIDPPHWERVVLVEVDGIVLESYGRCTSDYYKYWYIVFGMFHLGCLFYAIVLCFKTRNIDSDFAESKCILISIALMLEMLLLLVPILYFVQTNPSVYYFVRTMSNFLQLLAVLGLLFVPKMARLAHDCHREKKKKPKDRIRLSDVTRSDRDEAVDAIHELLLEDSHMFLTDQQRTDLTKAKALLLEGEVDPQRNQKLRYIPNKLLRLRGRKRTSDAITSSVNKVDYNTACFIMKEYGGIPIESDDSITSGFSNMKECEEIPIESDDSITSRVVNPLVRFEKKYILPEFQNLSSTAKQKVCKMLSWQSLKSWDFDIFEFQNASGGNNPLLFLGWAILGSPHAQTAMAQECDINDDGSPDDGYNFVNSSLRIPMATLCNYLRTMQDDYRVENPFHNAIHAADVLQSLNVLLQIFPDWKYIPQEELFAVLLGAAVHDVAHPGRNNAFQTKSRTDLALIYNDVSVLENKHASHAFITMLLGDDTNENAVLSVRRRNSSYINYSSKSNQQHLHPPTLNVLCHASDKQIASMRQKIVDAILHTDMSKHFGLVDCVKGIRRKQQHASATSLNASDDEDESVGWWLSDEESRWKLLVYMLHLADISGQTRGSVKLCVEWTNRVMEEFFTQGDHEAALGLPVSECCNRKTTNVSQAQLGFLEFVILPSYQVLADFIPEVRKQILPNIHKNYEYWTKQKEEHDRMQSLEAANLGEAKV